jgi:DNA modification methylase
MNQSSIDIRLGDCVERTSEIADASIDLILTSPPYDKLRRYGSGSEFDFEGLAGQCKRVLKPGGVLVWVVGDETVNGGETGTSFRQSLHFQEIGLRRHDTMIYVKRNYVPLTHRRYEQTFEFMFVHSKGAPKTFGRLTDPCKHVGDFRVSSTHYHDGETKSQLHRAGQPYAERKTRPNVWSYALHGKGHGHPAPFPLQLAIDHILSWTNHGDLVLDPFVGSGTTLLACLQADRHGIGIDKDPAYCEIARRRIAAELDKCPLLTGTDRS